MTSYRLLSCDRCNLLYVMTEAVVETVNHCPLCCNNDKVKTELTFNEDTYGLRDALQRKFDEYALYPEAWMFFPEVTIFDDEEVPPDEFPERIQNLAANCGIELYVMEGK